MGNQELSTLVNDAVQRYASDETMLDALLQWASNPTSMSAGYGLEENYPYIGRNLVARYGISRLEAERRVAELRSVCDSLAEQAEKLPIEPRRRIGEIQSLLLEMLTQGEPGQVLRQGVLKRLRETSDETRRALLVFQLLENAGRTISPDHLTSPPDRWKTLNPNFRLTSMPSGAIQRLSCKCAQRFCELVHTMSCTGCRRPPQGAAQGPRWLRAWFPQ